MVTKVSVIDPILFLIGNYRIMESAKFLVPIVCYIIPADHVHKMPIFDLHLRTRLYVQCLRVSYIA
jgi:hypothetical protein